MFMAHALMENRNGPPNLTIDRTSFEMWLVLAGSPKSISARI